MENGVVGYDEASRYEPPSLLKFLHVALDVPRQQYSTAFADYLSSDEDVKQDYTNGLLILICILGGAFLSWGCILMFLKLKGSEVGCASGRSFEKRKDSFNAAESTDLEFSESMKSVDPALEETSFPSSSICSSDIGSFYDSTTSILHSASDDEATYREGPRAFRTRVFFIIFACFVLACVPVGLALSFAPMKEVMKSPDDMFAAGRDVILQVNTAFSSIKSALDNALEILAETPTEFREFCPNVTFGNQSDQLLKVDLQELANLISGEYLVLERYISQNVSEVETLLYSIEEAMNGTDVTFNRVNHVVWFVPGLLLGVSIVTAFATFGVILAWKQESGLRFQRFMSYVALPAFIVLCSVSWILAAATLLSTALSADFCLAGTNHTPEHTMTDLISGQGFYPNSTGYSYVMEYIGGCQGGDPTAQLVALEGLSQTRVDEIWKHISTADSVGRSMLSKECGGTGINELLSGARNIAKILTKVRRGLDSASDSLECERVYPLYTQVIHESICTDFAGAAAWGSLTYLLLGIAMMVMISLRAAWRHRIAEEKIYHDENEVAENMILDEHEEYLRYISKYKHEWQEYDGIGLTSMRRSTSFSASEDEEVSGEIYSLGSDSGSNSGSQTSYVNPLDNLVMTDENVSLASGDISFPSLNVPPTDESSVDDSPIVPVPPPLLVDKRSDEETDDTDADKSHEALLLSKFIPSKFAMARSKSKSAAKTQPEEEKIEVSSRAGKNICESLSSETDVSTDFSSIGRAAGAGMSTSLYWRQQIGAGIEVAFSSDVSDSLVVSPTSEIGGITSFDLTRTPSPKRSQSSIKEPNTDASKVDNVLLPQSSSSADDVDDKKARKVGLSLKSLPSALSIIPVSRKQSSSVRRTSVEVSDDTHQIVSDEASRQHFPSRVGNSAGISKQHVERNHELLPSHFSRQQSSPPSRGGYKSEQTQNSEMFSKPYGLASCQSCPAPNLEPKGLKSEQQQNSTKLWNPYGLARRQPSPAPGLEAKLRKSADILSKPYALTKQQSCPAHGDHAVKFKEEKQLIQSPVQRHVESFSKIGPKIGDRPLTPTRTPKTKLFNLVRKFDPRPTAPSDDEQTI